MIGILADSHDNLAAIKRAVAMFQEAGCKLILHAGDVIAPFAARELEKAGCPVRAVFGNCDGERDGLRAVFDPLGGIHEEPHIFDHLGEKFLLTHRHEKIDKLLKKHAPRVLIYGHTHQPDCRTEAGTLIINPGEAGGWLSGRRTAAILNPVTWEVEFISLA
jgi:hypothetical protein